MNATVLMTKAHMTLPTPKPQHRGFNWNSNHTTDQKPSTEESKSTRHSKNKNFCSRVTKKGTYHQEPQRYAEQQVLWCKRQFAQHQSTQQYSVATVLASIAGIHHWELSTAAPLGSTPEPQHISRTHHPKPTPKMEKKNINFHQSCRKNQKLSLKEHQQPSLLRRYVYRKSLYIQKVSLVSLVCKRQCVRDDDAEEFGN